MEKRIYAVKVGRKPGIYINWLDAYDQIQQYPKAVMRSFTYKEELDKDDENLEGSFAYAMKQANLYMKEEVKDEAASSNSSNSKPADPKKFMDIDDSDDLPFGESDEYVEDTEDDFSGDMDVVPDIKKETIAPKAVATDPKAKGNVNIVNKEDYAEIFRRLKFKHNTRGNSPWLELLLAWAGGANSFLSGQIYMGRYSVTSLYLGLLYLILEPDTAFERYGGSAMMSIHEIDILKNSFLKSQEYLTLKERLAHLEAIDLQEVLARNTELADAERKSILSMMPTGYKAMKAFIKKGNQTLISLYDELLSDHEYVRKLLKVSGPYANKDIKEIKEPEYKETEITMQELVMQATAIGISLKEVVIGQNEAIDKLENAYFYAEKNVRTGNKKKGPRGVYLFAGPPGVGKTYTAEHLARILDIPYKRFDMASYSHRESSEELMGISDFWKSAKSGVLTEYVRNNPRCIILLDEIEKANRTVIQGLLRILDDGVGFDRYYDRDISFENAIIILTTNAGKQLYNSGEDENLTRLPDSVVVDALRKDMDVETKVPFFPPEIVSRISSHTIIMFNHLKAVDLRKVIKSGTDKQIEKTKKKYGYNLMQGSDNLVSTVQFSAGINTDARNASKIAGKIIDAELYNLLVLAEEKHGLNGNGGVKQIQWEMDFTNATEEIRQFYGGEKNCVVAVFGEISAIWNDLFVKNNVRVMATTDLYEFENILQRENVLFAIVDYEFGLNETNNSLNIVDAVTTGKEAFKKIQEHGEKLTVYLLTHRDGYDYSAREKEELRQSGIEDFVEAKGLHLQIEGFYHNVCCQKATETMQLRHQILTYETRNELDLARNTGKIVFYNLKLEVAVEAEDKGMLLSDDLRPNKRWSDICVSRDVKEELQFFVEYLQNPKEYMRKGVRAPKGALMYGPPGTGKTSLAKVVATESDINFLSVSADQLVQGGAGFVHYQFRVARKYAPAVLFIDEIDAIGASRGKNGVNTALNALLTEMDGFKKVDDKPVFIMAATNLGSAIDPALIRRFDRSFCVDLPDKEARKWILERLIKLHANMFVISEKELESVASRSVGMSPAALENVIETALREGVRSDKKVDDVIFDEAFEKCNYGEAREINSQEEIKNTAYHEAGHALIYMYYGRKPDYMSVVARGDFGGYVTTSDIIYHPTKDMYLQKICAMLGGRAAELEAGYGLTPGASYDLKNATKLATKMVCSYGMYEEEIGLAVISEENIHQYPEAQKLVNQILSQQMKKAREIIKEKRDALERLVYAVMHSEQKYLTQKELLNLYEGKAETE